MQASFTPDDRLLDDFVKHCDPCAFRTLVARHGPMVLRVCRSVLRNPHDAEDAFQTTFLVLLRKAETIRDSSALERWLCGVAYKTATRGRRNAAKRREHERNWEDIAADDPAKTNVNHDTYSVLREELDRLPEKYRAPLVLCYFEGLTHEEAARHLGWASGTVKIRLVRGRRLLRERLDRRKIALGAGLLVRWKRETVIPADSLTEATLRHAVDDRTSPSASHARHFRAIGSLVSIAGLLAVYIAVLWSLSLSTSLCFSYRRSVPAIDITHLPANLMDVLAVDCR